MPALNEDEVCNIATLRKWVLAGVNHQKNSSLLFVKVRGKHIISIQVDLLRCSATSTMFHYFGKKSKLIRVKITNELLSRIFENPRVHTDPTIARIVKKGKSPVSSSQDKTWKEHRSAKVYKKPKYRNFLDEED